MIGNMPRLTSESNHAVVKIYIRVAPTHPMIWKRTPALFAIATWMASKSLEKVAKMLVGLWLS